MTNQPNTISLTWSFPIFIGIPYGSANIDFFYTESERMPVLTEYVLRLLKIVEQAPASAIGFYLGLSNNELKVLINDLLNKHYIRKTVEEDLALDESTTDKLFIKNEENQLIPRISKLLEGRRTVTVVYAANRHLLFNKSINSENEFVDYDLYDLNKIPSRDEIGTAFQNQFDLVAVENEKKSSFHSIIKIRMKASGLYSVPARLDIDTDGNSNIVVENRERNKTLDAILLPEISKSFHCNTSIQFPIENTNPGFLLWLKLFPKIFQDLQVNKLSFQDIVSLLVGNGLSSDEMTISVGENLSSFVDPEDFFNQTKIGFFLQNILDSKFCEVIWKPAIFHDLSDIDEKYHQRDYEIGRNLLKSLTEQNKIKNRIKFVELRKDIYEPSEDLSFFSQILNQPQNSFILVKGRAVICSYYCSIGKLLGQSERTLYVPVTVCSTNKELIGSIENMLNRASQSRSFDDSVQSRDMPLIEEDIPPIAEVHTCIRQLILKNSPNNDFVNVCSIGSGLQRQFQSIKTFWAKNNVSGLPEFARKYSNLYQIQIKQGKGTCRMIEIRNLNYFIVDSVALI